MKECFLACLLGLLGLVAFLWLGNSFSTFSFAYVQQAHRHGTGTEIIAGWSDSTSSGSWWVSQVRGTTNEIGE